MRRRAGSRGALPHSRPVHLRARLSFRLELLSIHGPVAVDSRLADQAHSREDSGCHSARDTGLVVARAAVVWVAAVFAYVRLGGLVAECWRAAIFALGVAGTVAARMLLARFPHRWSWEQVFSLEGLTSLTAVEQVWLFDAKYLLIAAAIAVALVLLHRSAPTGGSLSEPWVHVWVLHLFGLMILPAAVQLRSATTLAYIPQRLSLFTGLPLAWRYPA